ncbi:MAG: serine/threonine-protein kinase [Gemmatimonadales bacterium]
MKVCTACGIEYPDDVLFCQRDGTPLRASDPTADLVGQVIAERYHIKKKLGEGGMGQVYLAEHVKMGRRCAVKIMSAALLNDPEAVSRFNREAANASRISHANVCAIYDFGETSDGLIYLAMEFIEGRSLTDLLKETGPLPLPRAGGILAQAAEALQAAHDLGIVHRDLKPDNIMVTTARGRDVVKVVDFGIAKATGTDSRSQKVTRTGLVVGTPEYMSPEQLTGDPLDARSDIYSLGLVFYRMLTGVLPFKSESAQETMIKRLTDDPLPLAEALPGGRFPPRLQQIMNRALARSAADRYGSAAEFGRNVAALAAAASSAVDPEGDTQAMARLSGATEAIPATRVDSAAQAARRAAQEEPPTPTAQRAVRAPVAKSRSKAVPIAGAVVVLLAIAGGAWAIKGGALSGNRKSPETDGGQTVPPADTSQAKHDSAAAPAGNPAAGAPAPVTQAPKDTSRGGKPSALVTKPNPPTSNPASTVPAPIHGAGSQGESTGASVVKMPPVDDVFDPATRDKARIQAETIYNRSDLPDSTRGIAANLVAAAYQQDLRYKDALDWARRANTLHPNSTTQGLISQLEAKVGP